jgi:hypothetical protein
MFLLMVTYPGDRCVCLPACPPSPRGRGTRSAGSAVVCLRRSNKHLQSSTEYSPTYFGILCFFSTFALLLSPPPPPAAPLPPFQVARPSGFHIDFHGPGNLNPKIKDNLARKGNTSFDGKVTLGSSLCFWLQLRHCSRHGFLHQRMNANGSDTK